MLLHIRPIFRTFTLVRVGAGTTPRSVMPPGCSGSTATYMGKINHLNNPATRTKQWVSVLLLAAPMVVQTLGMLGLATSFVGKLPINCILYLLPALGFFLLWQIASNCATRTAAKVATILYAAWAIYFTLLELIGIDRLPAWALHGVTVAQIVTPLVLAYTASLVGKNNRMGDWGIFAIWIICTMCILESYWSVANSPISLWLFDGMAANDISVSAFKEVYRWFVIALNLLSIFAFGVICTSSAFSAERNPNEPDPRYTPINRYMVSTIVITLALIAIS